VVKNHWLPGVFALVVILIVSNSAPKVAFWLLLLIFLVLLINVKDYLYWALEVK